MYLTGLQAMRRDDLADLYEAITIGVNHGMSGQQPATRERDEPDDDGGAGSDPDRMAGEGTDGDDVATLRAQGYTVREV